MTTKNPRIAGYVSNEVHAALYAFMAERGVDGVSGALNLILEEYLNCRSEPEAGLSDRLNTAEGRIEVLEQEIKDIRDALQAPLTPGLSEFFKTAHEKHYGKR